MTMMATPRLPALRLLLVALLLVPLPTSAIVRRDPRQEQRFDDGWRFHRGVSAADDPTACALQFPVDLGQTQCMGLELQPAATTEQACQASCCDKAAASSTSCQTWQFCPAGKGCEVRVQKKSRGRARDRVCVYKGVPGLSSAVCLSVCLSVCVGVRCLLRQAAASACVRVPVPVSSVLQEGRALALDGHRAFSSTAPGKNPCSPLPATPPPPRYSVAL